jgi:D-inositol-3-phosphate glycosyltransferase
VGARRHAGLFSWDRTVDALVAAYTSAGEELARTAIRAARPRLVGGPLRAVPGASVAR